MRTGEGSLRPVPRPLAQVALAGALCEHLVHADAGDENAPQRRSVLAKTRGQRGATSGHPSIVTRPTPPLATPPGHYNPARFAEIHLPGIERACRRSRAYRPRELGCGWLPKVDSLLTTLYSIRSLGREQNCRASGTWTSSLSSATESVSQTKRYSD
jgi:hypothetical protein